MSSPRRSLGNILGNGVRFGKTYDMVLVGEGIETALSLKNALPQLPMVASPSAAHLAAWDLSPGLRRIIIAADNDLAGRRAAQKLAKRAKVAGVEAETVVSRAEDFNDDLRGATEIGSKVE